MTMNRRTFLAAGSAVGVLAATPRGRADWQPSQRYPDPLIKIIEPGFTKYRLPLAKVEKIALNSNNQPTGTEPLEVED